MNEGNKGWDVWYRAAEIMSNVDEEATLWDLAKAMYRYFNNRDMPIKEPNDYDLVCMHKEGYSPSDIAAELDMNDEAVRDYLESMGFNPWRNTTRGAHNSIIRDHNKNFTVAALCKKYTLSRYVIKKVIREFNHAKVTRF